MELYFILFYNSVFKGAVLVIFVHIGHISVFFLNDNKRNLEFRILKCFILKIVSLLPLPHMLLQWSFVFVHAQPGIPPRDKHSFVFHISALPLIAFHCSYALRLELVLPPDM